jgi:hypothetical protein
MIFADYFELVGKNFLVVGDRLSGWPEVIQVGTGTKYSGAKGLCRALRQLFATFGVPEEISSDGGPEFVAGESIDFYNRWGISHRLSSAYHPQSNGRAEVAVKLVKRMLEDNIATDGSLNTDGVVRALLQQRNTPDRDCKLSPAEVLFGRRLRDSMPQLDKSVMVFESQQVHSQWHQAWAAKEDAIRARLVNSCEQLEEHSKELPPLREGDHVFIQNQSRSVSRPNKWDRQGKVVAIKNNDQCLVRVDGSGRLTLRNRRFLRKFNLRSTEVSVEGANPEQRAFATPKEIAKDDASGVRDVTRRCTESPVNDAHAKHDAMRDTMHDAMHDAMHGAAGGDGQVRREASHPTTHAAPESPPSAQTKEPDSGMPPAAPTNQPARNARDPDTRSPQRESTAPVRRSTRTFKQRECYDASSGQSSRPTAVSDSV